MRYLSVADEYRESLKKSNVSIMTLVQLNFSTTNIVRVCSAGYTVKWNTFDWIGVGNVGSISAIEESSDLGVKGVEMTLTGVPTDLISVAFLEDYQWKPVYIYMAPMSLDLTLNANWDTYPLIDSITDTIDVYGGLPPALIFSGRIDKMDIRFGKTATIILRAESRLIDWKRPKIRRYNNEDQKIRFPNDRGFEYIERIANATIQWGPK